MTHHSRNSHRTYCNSPLFAGGMLPCHDYNANLVCRDSQLSAGGMLLHHACNVANWM